MPHSELLARLGAADPPSPVVWFVVLCTYYGPRLGEVENRLVGAGVPPLRVPPTPAGGLAPRRLPDCLATLRGLVDEPVAFDTYALGLIKALDRALEDMTPSILDAEVVKGFDGRPYRVRRLVNPIAERLGRDQPPHARQGTLAAYARRVALVRADKLGEFSIDCARIESGAPAVFKRLLEARDRLSVMLWPFSGPIRYATLDDRGPGSAADFRLLKEPRNEGDLVRQVEAAIDAASAEQTTMLVFPELSFSPGTLAAARARLATHGIAGHPILCVAGLCHAPLGSQGAHVNEAVVLGPDGSELHRHRKLRRFADRGLTAEQIETGFTLAILETPCGNLATPICLDVFAPASKDLLLASHATLLLVPSLSPSTGPHQAAAREFAAARWASSFVCNRWLSGFDAQAPSFYLVPGRDPALDDGARTHLRFALAG